MAEFVCKFGTSAGEILERVYVADNEKNLRDQMEQQGYYVFGIQRKLQATTVVKSLISFKRKKVSDKQFMIFNQELAALIHSGLPLLRSLELLMERIDNAEFSVVLENVYQKVKSGTSLSEAFSTYPGVFPRVYTASILAGEKERNIRASHPPLFNVHENQHCYPNQSCFVNDLSSPAVTVVFRSYRSTAWLCNTKIHRILFRIWRKSSDGYKGFDWSRWFCASEFHIGSHCACRFDSCVSHLH